MGRGYSVTRSSSKRPTNKMKRGRSTSAPKMKATISKIAEKVEQIKTKEEAAEVLKKMREEESSEDEMLSEDEDERISRPEVFTKFRTCGKIADEALEKVCVACVEGANTKTLCELGDSTVAAATKGIFQKSKDETGNKMKKGIAFPTSVSVNNVLCYHSPASAGESLTLQKGDVVKVHLAVHLDGYPCNAARTLVVGDVSDARVANMIVGSAAAVDGMMRLMKPGALNADITDFIHGVARSMDVQPIEGVLSNRTKRWVMDGMQAIISRRVIAEDPQQDVADVEIGVDQVWTLDVAFTTAPSYKMKIIDEKPNIHRRNEVIVNTRNASASALVQELREKVGCFGFSTTQLENPARSRLGLFEIRKSGMIDDFAPLGCKLGTGLTARFCCTIAINDKRVHILSGAPVVHDSVRSACTASVTAEVKEILETPLVNEKDPKSVGDEPIRSKGRKLE